MGAWIETFHSLQRNKCKRVAPYMGAWIETAMRSGAERTEVRRTLHGCVD